MRKVPYKGVVVLKHILNVWPSKVIKEKTVNREYLVCVLGSTIWSGVRQFLNEMEFKDEYKDMLKQSYNTLLRWHDSLNKYRSNFITECYFLKNTCFTVSIKQFVECFLMNSKWKNDWQLCNKCCIVGKVKSCRPKT